MMRMPHFPKNRPQGLLLPLQLRLQKPLPPPQLFPKHARPRQPRQSHPSQKRRPFPFGSPFLSFQRIRRSRPPLRRSFKHAAFRPLCGLPALHRPDKSPLCQFPQRIINLRPRNPRPFPHAPPFQRQIRLLPMHSPLRQQTKQDQIRRSQHKLLPIPHDSSFNPNSSMRVLCAPQLALSLEGRICVRLFFSSPLSRSSSLDSNTTTDISPPATADPAPAPPPPGKHPNNKYPDAAAPPGTISRTASPDSAAPTAPRSAPPKSQNPAASQDRWRSDSQSAAVP
jgi:hypothetical protein